MLCAVLGPDVSALFSPKQQTLLPLSFAGRSPRNPRPKPRGGGSSAESLEKKGRRRPPSDEWEADTEPDSESQEPRVRHHGDRQAPVRRRTSDEVFESCEERRHHGRDRNEAEERHRKQQADRKAAKEQELHYATSLVDLDNSE